MRYLFSALLLATGLAGCVAGGFRQSNAAPDRDQLTIAMPMPQDGAAMRVYSAFMAEGLTVGAAQGDVIESSPVVRSMFRVRRIVTYRARVLPAADSTSRVVLSVSAHDAQLGTADVATTAGKPDTRDDRITESSRGKDATDWQRLERIAAALRQ
ncbi:MAG: hypothetical protein NVS4B3_24750 [Gemmatimonadaceae bacterium]